MKLFFYFLFILFFIYATPGLSDEKPSLPNYEELKKEVKKYTSEKDPDLILAKLDNFWTVIEPEQDKVDWKSIGFQVENPATDLRGTGILV
uniref:ELMO domain-containing protein n=1 Tax=Ditylenchus dipsaci TaxID=166011 RepID=A0A915D4F0_9BILA